MRLIMNNYWGDKITSYDKLVSFDELDIKSTSLKSILFKILCLS